MRSRAPTTERDVTLRGEPTGGRRVCFSVLHAYPLFDPGVRACVGGMETRAWQLATGLSEQSDDDVHFVVQAPRRFRRRMFGGITVWNRGDGFDRIRYEVSEHLRSGPPSSRRRKRFSPALLWQLPLLAAARPFRNPPPPADQPDPFYRQIDPDVYCVFGVSANAASVVSTAKATGQPALLFLASNDDLDERFAPGARYVTPYGERADVCWLALSNATLIVVQNVIQQQLLKERFGRDGHLLPSPINLTRWDREAQVVPPDGLPTAADRFVLWVGRADEFHKRPRLCLELARRLPDVPFLMIMNPGDVSVASSIRKDRPPNVDIIESVPFSVMPAVMHRAAMLVSTGAPQYEGTPNVFLQAAASRIPVASLEVPLPTGIEGGLTADGDLDGLARIVRELRDSPERARTLGESGRKNVAERHDLPAVMTGLRQLLDEACRVKPATNCRQP